MNDIEKKQKDLLTANRHDYEHCLQQLKKFSFDIFYMHVNTIYSTILTDIWLKYWDDNLILPQSGMQIPYNKNVFGSELLGETTIINRSPQYYSVANFYPMVQVSSGDKCKMTAAVIGYGTNNTKSIYWQVTTINKEKNLHGCQNAQLKQSGQLVIPQPWFVRLQSRDQTYFAIKQPENVEPFVPFCEELLASGCISNQIEFMAMYRGEILLPFINPQTALDMYLQHIKDNDVTNITFEASSKSNLTETKDITVDTNFSWRHDTKLLFFVYEFITPLESQRSSYGKKLNNDTEVEKLADFLEISVARETNDNKNNTTKLSLRMISNETLPDIECVIMDKQQIETWLINHAEWFYAKYPNVYIYSYLQITVPIEKNWFSIKNNNQ